MRFRKALMILAALAVAWVLFSTFFVPRLIERAYEGKSVELLNQLIGHPEEHPLEFYLGKWRLASWVTLLAAMAVLLPLASTRPNELMLAWKKYWFRRTPLVFLGLLRIVAVGVQLVLLVGRDVYNRRHLAELASLPDSLYNPLPALQLFTWPWGWDARPSAAIVFVIYWCTLAVGLTGLVGLKSRLSLLMFAAGNTFLQAFSYSFGDLHHPEALMIITLWLLVFSPAGSVLSVDQLLHRRKRGIPGAISLKKTSRFAGWPLLLVRHLIALVYLDAALRKFYVAGLDWLNGYTLQFYLLADASKRDGQFGLWLGQQHGLVSLFSWVTIIWEATFFLLLFFPRLAWVYLPLGISLHVGMCLSKVACFYQFLALYVVFLPLLWNHGSDSSSRPAGSGWNRAAPLRHRTVPAGERPVILFDGICNLCNQWVQFVIRRDPKGHVLFAPLQSDAGKVLQVNHGLRPDDLDSIVLIEGKACYTKSDAALRIARYLSGPWPVIRLLTVVPRGIRNWCYDVVARNRYRWFGKREVCLVPSGAVRARFLNDATVESPKA
jgi:predicted DCC family thiol-disulfide oxidoreductase YuxK